MTLDIDTSRFLVDPQSKTFLKDMKALSDVFDMESTRKALIYITLMYDKESYYRKEIGNLMDRKFACGEAAGFPLQDNERFNEIVEEAMLGKHASFNKAVVQYAAMQYDLKFIKLISYELNFYRFNTTYMSIGDKDGKIKRQINELEVEITALQREIFGGDETKDLLKALYQGTAASRLRIDPEGSMDEFSVNRLAYTTPWGNYKLDKANVVNFVGDSVPKD
jgi:hypothetical protein